MREEIAKIVGVYERKQKEWGLSGVAYQNMPADIEDILQLAEEIRRLEKELADRNPTD